MILTKEAEFSLNRHRNAALARLLDSCFPDTFEGRTYFKQRPHFRIFAESRGALIGQMGIDFRVIGVGDSFMNIFGIVDLCVAPQSRGRGIGSFLIDEAERLAAAGQVDAMVAMADRHDLYAAKGYRNLNPARCRWLAIDERRSVDLIERDMTYCFLYKCLKPVTWPDGDIDLLGYLF
ncbi:MAG: GNAT family N-acetyltransferase [Azospirillaceae bacterium]|nr:GNAT family N-acetyltransferase [Azospirillaceae bacterium]